MPAAQQADTLCELNVLEQVINVSVSTVMLDAWASGQQVQVHGWAFGVHDGLLNDLGVTVGSTESLDAAYRTALERIAQRHR